MLNTNPDDPAFIEAIKNLKEGDTIEVADGTLVVEHLFTVPTHFPFHQRIFDAGMILKKEGRNTRVYIEAEKIGLQADDMAPGKFDDRQIVDGEVVEADRGVGYKPE